MNIHVDKVYFELDHCQSVFALASFDVPIKKMPQVVTNISGITTDSVIDTPCTLRGSMGKIKISEFEFEKMSRSK